ncbi:hypothetical protein F8388_017076 [Cannabis sativa]|uniref:TF-B3 domain-containing protein n=1 Tax=Cannabis sativa TaxID=3483 RepID=A0A7J6HFG6_CANSA|nr:hypothetical protein F8388_017076 [Cannabis sativa]KAF4393160.1 hypothetical protein G4B88_001894 [Cannabis sativa]
MSEYEEAKALKLISDFKTTRPFFKVIMQEYYGQQLNLPVEFATGNDYQPCDDTIPLQISYGDGMNSSPWHAGYKTWDVEYKFEVYNGVPTPTFQAGWPAFVQDNNLKVGDVCMFVLLREMYIAFNVLIFRVQILSEPKEYCMVGGRTFLVRNRGEFSEDSSCPNQQVFIEKSRLIERALFKSKNHFFSVVIEPSLLGSGRSLTIPLYFAKDYLKNEGIVILLTDRRYCSVQFELKNKNNSKMRAVFSGGWKDFTKDNYLQVNDVCIFEFLKGSANVFKVTIHRADEYASD